MLLYVLANGELRRMDSVYEAYTSSPPFSNNGMDVAGR